MQWCSALRSTARARRERRAEPTPAWLRGLREVQVSKRSEGVISRNRKSLSSSCKAFGRRHDFKSRHLSHFQDSLLAWAVGRTTRRPLTPPELPNSSLTAAAPPTRWAWRRPRAPARGRSSSQSPRAGPPAVPGRSAGSCPRAGSPGCCGSCRSAGCWSARCWPAGHTPRPGSPTAGRPGLLHQGQTRRRRRFFFVKSRVFYPNNILRRHVSVSRFEVNEENEMSSSPASPDLRQSEIFSAQQILRNDGAVHDHSNEMYFESVEIWHTAGDRSLPQGHPDVCITGTFKWTFDSDNT